MMMYDELVKRLRELHPEEFGDKWDFAFACQQAMNEAANAIEELQKPKWVSVKKDLPNPYDLVLVVNTFGGVHYGYYDTNLKWYTANNWLEDTWTWTPNVTHWMQLPQPPKEEI